MESSAKIIKVQYCATPQTSALLVPIITRSISPASQDLETESQKSVELSAPLTGSNNFELTISNQTNDGNIQNESTVKAEEDEKRTPNFNRNKNFEASGNVAKSPSLDDQDQLFFRSLLPDLQNLNSDQKLEFRKQVLDLLQRIRRGTPKDTVAPHPPYLFASCLRNEKDDYQLPLASLEFINSRITEFQKYQLELIELKHQNKTVDASRRFFSSTPTNFQEHDYSMMLDSISTISPITSFLCNSLPTSLLSCTSSYSSSCSSSPYSSLSSTSL